MNSGLKKSVYKVLRPLSKVIHGRDLVCLSDGYYFLVRFSGGSPAPSPALLGDPHFRLVLMRDYSLRGRLYNILQDDLYQYDEIVFPHKSTLSVSTGANSRPNIGRVT